MEERKLRVEEKLTIKIGENENSLARAVLM